METKREENAAEPAVGQWTRYVKWVLVIAVAIALVAVLTVVLLQVVVAPSVGNTFSTIMRAI